MTEPLIYTKNYVTSDDVFTVSHGSANIAKIYDRDNDSQWESDMADDDTTEISIVVEFYEGLIATDRDVDTVILTNHNLADITVEYWNGSAYVPWLSTSTILDDFTKLSGSLVTTSKVRLKALATQAANAEKAIGEFIVCALALDLGEDMRSYEPNARELVSRNMLGDGSMHQTFTKFSPNRTQKYEARARFQYVTLANLEALLALKEAGDPILWQPESSSRPDQIFLVNIYGTIKTPYSNDFKGAGYTVDLDLKEV